MLWEIWSYLKYLKFGFARSTDDSSIDIRRGALTRDQAIQLVNLYDNFKLENEDIYCEYYKITKSKFNKILDKWANKKLFKKNKNSWEPIFKNQ